MTGLRKAEVNFSFRSNPTSEGYITVMITVETLDYAQFARTLHHAANLEQVRSHDRRCRLERRAPI
jgi:hypothetical protein